MQGTSYVCLGSRMMKQLRAEEHNTRHGEAHQGGSEHTHISAREQTCGAITTNVARDLESAHHYLTREVRIPGEKICLTWDNQLVAGAMSQMVGADPAVISTVTVPTNATQGSAVVTVTGARSGSTSTTFTVHPPVIVVEPGDTSHAESSMNTYGVCASTWSSPRVAAEPVSHLVDRCRGLLLLAPLE